MTANGRKKFTRTLAACTAAAALAAPVAQASPIIDPGSGYASPTSDPIVIEGPPVTTTIDGGFDWGAAAIGAGGAGMLILLSLGGAAHVSRGRTRVSGA